MKNIIFYLMLFLFFVQVNAQLIKIEQDNYVSEVPIYHDENGNKYSTVINLKFTKKVIDVPK